MITTTSNNQWLALLSRMHKCEEMKPRVEGPCRAGHVAWFLVALRIDFLRYFPICQSMMIEVLIHAIALLSALPCPAVGLPDPRSISAMLSASQLLVFSQSSTRNSAQALLSSTLTRNTSPSIFASRRLRSTFPLSTFMREDMKDVT
jgi:hypothetical protein